MQSLSNSESRRVFELVTAFEEHQITLSELNDCLKPVSSETLQVVATFGSARDAFEPGTPRIYFCTPGSSNARCSYTLSLLAHPSASATRSAMDSPIGIDDVAAGEGALQTCNDLGPSTKRKSSTNAPSGISACARTPADDGSMSVS